MLVLFFYWHDEAGRERYGRQNAERTGRQYRGMKRAYIYFLHTALHYCIYERKRSEEKEEENNSIWGRNTPYL